MQSIYWKFPVHKNSVAHRVQRSREPYSSYKDFATIFVSAYRTRNLTKLDKECLCYTNLKLRLYKVVILSVSLKLVALSVPLKLVALSIPMKLVVALDIHMKRIAKPSI